MRSPGKPGIGTILAPPVVSQRLRPSFSLRWAASALATGGERAQRKDDDEHGL